MTAVKGSVSIRGMAELKDRLGHMSMAVQRGALERTLRNAAKPLADTIRSMTPVHSGELDRSIVISTTVSSGGAGRAAYARTMQAGGSRGEAAAAQRAANQANAGQFSAAVFIGPAAGVRHARWVEFGTGLRRSRKTGKSSGVMPADPYMRPAWDQHRGAMIGRIATELRAEIDRVLARAAKRAARG